MNILGNSIKEIRKSKKMTQTELSKLTGFKQNTISNHENGKRQLDETDIRTYAAALGVEPQQLFNLSKPTPSLLSAVTPPPSQKPTDELTETIIETVRELSPEGKKSVLGYAREVLEREEDEAALAEQPLFTIYYTSAAKAGPTGFSYDDYDNDKYVYTDEEPPRYDIATMVDGWSMAPDYDDGDILYLRDYGTSHYNGQECVVVVDDKNYFKKVYTTNDGLLLVSINEDKDQFPDFTIPFPPNEDTHIKIFEVVGSFTPVEG
ncbi:helix-turn-helix transcriptional regulator [Streptococcus sp. E29BA]|uniref:LexA family transcriptional regulator n=1 Tax=Streptococcus sp. E29BA TaxID=3278716 RepID=UPI00359D7FBB